MIDPGSLKTRLVIQQISDCRSSTAVTVANGGTGDARVQISKESAAKTASVVFADAFSGRAEFGLVGSDAFKLKVSNDGSTFVEAFNIDQTTGNLSLPRGVALTGVISPAQITSNQNDYNPTGLATASIVNLSSDASRNVSGLAGGAEGRVVSLLNTGSQIVNLLGESASSTAANRFALGGDLAVGAKQAVLLRYDGTAARWYALARPGASGSGQLMAASNLSDLASAATARANLGVRDVLTANRTYYVRTDGSNSNNGLANTSGGAFLTLAYVLSIVAMLDFNNFTITIQIADGTYTESLSIPNCVGQSGRANLVLQGNATTPANVVITQAGSYAPTILVPFGSKVTLKDFKVAATNNGRSFFNAGGDLAFGNIDFGVAGVHIYAQGGLTEAIGNWTISGDATVHVSAAASGAFVKLQSRTATASGSRAFSFGFVWSDQGGAILAQSMTFTGTYTGSRYQASLGGSIQTYGGGASYFPGNAAGVATTGYYA